MQKFLTNLLFERSFTVSFKENIVDTTAGVEFSFYKELKLKVPISFRAVLSGEVS